MPTTPFGQLLRHHRKQAGLNQTQLAEKMGYTDPSLLSRFEQGKRLPNRDQLELLFTALELSEEESRQLSLTYLSALSQSTPPPQPVAPAAAPPPTLAGITWAQLSDLCAQITRQRLLAAAKHKYQVDLYWPRDPAHCAFAQFLASEQRCFVLTGPSGVGKSNFMLALAETLPRHSDHCLLMLDAARLPANPHLTELIGQDLLAHLSTAGESCATLWPRLAQVDAPAGSRFILGIDALNEHSQPQALLRQLDELARHSWPRLKIIFSCRPETWQTLRRRLNLTESLYFRAAGTDAIGVELTPFSPQELPQVYALYRQFFNLQTDYQSLSNEGRETLRDPLGLFLAAGSYENAAIPPGLKATGLLEVYMQGLLRSGRLTPADLACLTEAVLPQMFQPERYRNSVALSFLDAAGNGRWFNHPALNNLLDAGILVRTETGLREKIAFKYERFYDYFAGRWLLDWLQATPNRAEAYRNLLQALPTQLFLWGPLQLALQSELRSGQLGVIEALAEQHLPLLEDILMGALLTISGENQREAGAIIQAMHHSRSAPVRKTAVALAGRLAYLPLLREAAHDSDSGVRLATMRAAHFLWGRSAEEGQHLLADWAAQVKWRCGWPLTPLAVLEVCLGATVLVLTEPQQTPAQAQATRHFLQTTWQNIFARLLFVNPAKPNTPAHKLVRRWLLAGWSKNFRRLLGPELGQILADYFPLPPERRPVFERLLGCFELDYAGLLQQEELLVEVMRWNDLVSVYVIDIILLLTLPREGDQGLPLVQRLFQRALNVERPLHSTGHLITAIYAIVNRDPDPISPAALAIYRDLVQENFDKTWGVFYTNRGEARVQHGISLYSVVEWQKAGARQPEMGLYALAKALHAPQPPPPGVLELLVRDTLLASSLVGHPHLTLAAAKYLFTCQEAWRNQPHLPTIIADGLATVRLYAPDEVERFFTENDIPPTMQQLIYSREVMADQWWLKMFFPKLAILMSGATAQSAPVRMMVTRGFKAIPAAPSLEQWLRVVLQELVCLIFEQPVTC